MRMITAPFNLAGRLLLWLCCWPLGLWRSMHHGRAKQTRQIKRTIEKAAR